MLRSPELFLAIFRFNFFNTTRNVTQLRSVRCPVHTAPLPFSLPLSLPLSLVNMKLAVAAILAGSAAAFAPRANSGRSGLALNAEKSQALPFLNRPPLVSHIAISRP